MVFTCNAFTEHISLSLHLRATPFVFVFCFHLQAYDVVVIRNVKQKHALARKYFSQIPEMAKCLHDAEIQPAALSNLLVSKPITNATK